MVVNGVVITEFPTPAENSIQSTPSCREMGVSLENAVVKVSIVKCSGQLQHYIIPIVFATRSRM